MIVVGDPALHDPDFTDVVFHVTGQGVPLDYGEPLWHGLCAALPWLAQEPAASVLPLERAGCADGAMCLSRHSRLVLRLPKTRAAEATALSGGLLGLGEGIAVGPRSLRPLAPSEVLHARLVSFDTDDEGAFLVACARQLEAMEVAGRLVSGRARSVQMAGQLLPGFSLMVHGLSHAHSLRLQREGLGLGRQRGCGVFVPHKSIAAVGE